MAFFIMRQDTSIDGSAALAKAPTSVEPSEWVQGRRLGDPAPGERLPLHLSRESGDYRGHIIDGLLTLYHDDLKSALEERGVGNDESRTQGLKVFRLKEDPTKVVIREDLKRFFDDTDMLVGVKLIQTEDYADF